MATSRQFQILFVRDLSWLILERDLTFPFVYMVQLFCIVLEFCKYRKITQNKNGR